MNAKKEKNLNFWVNKMNEIEAKAKDDCKGYLLCLLDEDWRPSFCTNCNQYKHKMTENELESRLEDSQKEIQKLKEQYETKFVCAKNHNCIDCDDNIDCIEGRKTLSKAVKILEGSLSRIRSLIKEFGTSEGIKKIAESIRDKDGNCYQFLFDLQKWFESLEKEAST